MKKFLLIAVAAFGMLMTACSKDEVAQPVVEESTVTFTISAPELATRAHGDGLTATYLEYAVYNRADNAFLFKGTATMSALKATVEIPFVNGMEYDVLFWAGAPASPYKVDWNAQTVAYTDATALVSNSEDYDAFYAYVNDIPEITGPVTKTVELKRPFAQLNIITNDAVDAEKSGVTVKDVKVVVKKGYTAFDFVTGNGIKQGAVTFDTTAAQTTTDVLAVNYLFPAAEKSLVDVEFTYTDVAGKLGTGEVKEFATVPIQRNYRTNIVGSLLTSEGQFNIEIKPGFDGTNEVRDIADDEIWYTSRDGNIIIPYAIDVFGANIISNTYENGKGVIKFDGPITHIGEKAFYQSQTLKSITMPNTVVAVGDYAFTYSRLSTIILSSNLKEIGRWAFSQTELVNVAIPNTLVSIGDEAFYFIQELRTFTGKYASSDNRCLVINGEMHAFASAGLTEYSIPNGVNVIGLGVFASCQNLENIIIPNSVTTIRDGAFANCESLVDILIPNSVTTIGENAFYNCVALTDITIPDSVRVLGDYCFNQCEGLKQIVIPNSVVSIGKAAFYNCENLSNISIGKDVKQIGDVAFEGCSSIEEIIIPNGVESIGQRLFGSCINLNHVSIPGTVIEIPAHCFFECRKLSSITIHEGVERIGYEAFLGCDNLKTIIMPASIKRIEQQHFSVNNITSLYLKSLTPPFLNGWLFDVWEPEKWCQIYVPRGSAEDYRTSSNWNSYADNIVGYDF